MDDNQIDKIVCSVDAKYMINNSQGLLSVLHSTNSEHKICATNENICYECKSDKQNEGSISLNHLTNIASLLASKKMSLIV